MQQLFDLIEHTNRSIFLTGRAGTGKTTFLQEFVKKTTKKFAIVAPTGIAAINAGGVTIHSMFGLPLTTFAPTTDFIDRNEAINIPNLLPHFKYRRDKLKLLRTLEILIIDEVSMLRCDVLDMLDLALRSARKSQQRFGGVQILFIGDLYQLPPVVKAASEEILFRFYSSPFFFEAKALEGLNLLTVTLKKVYRQTDGTFLQMLNAIRDNNIEDINFDLLHSRYQPHFEPEEFYIRLVSHNQMADAINNKQLQSLPGRGRIYQAKIRGDFKEHLFPNEEALELKEGAQVMFIRNDKEEEKRFYNGKLATITVLDEDEIKVLPQHETKELTIARETWENKKYYVDEENKIAEEVVGSYEQFPFKLAWAVTIHKSQGLTFDKVIIDAGRSFTSGQVYVALSRCRTLEGIVLTSKIPAHAIISDKRIVDFQLKTEAGDDFSDILETEKYSYVIDKLLQKLNVVPLLDAAAEWLPAAKESRFLRTADTIIHAEKVSGVIRELDTVYKKFEGFINSRMKNFSASKKDWDVIEEKSKGAVNFFFKKIDEAVFDIIKECYAETKGTAGLKGYNDVLKGFIESTATYLSLLQQATLFETFLFENRESIPVIADVAKKPTHVISFQLFEEGKTPGEIAALRNITESTVLSHLAKIAVTGILDIERLFSRENIRLFEERFRKYDFKNLTDWKNALPDFFDYNEIRILLNHFRYQKEKQV
ncbi:MAG: helix-turn-helix domain-containing protein [Niabella sp.]